ncbi:MAG: alpha/beta fold hydrolase [Acidimicrobiales bacterium]
MAAAVDHRGFEPGAPDIGRPPLPPGRRVELPGRGVALVREIPGPTADAPVVVLLHGWTVTAALNWFRVYAPLAEHARVVSLDHRGHGAGIRSSRPFRLEDAADDAVALADVLGIDRFVVAGYSMGGPISQLVWRRHPDRVQPRPLRHVRPVVGARLERAYLKGPAGSVGPPGSFPDATSSTCSPAPSPCGMAATSTPGRPGSSRRSVPARCR